MTDSLAPERRSWNMSRIRGKDTKPEKQGISPYRLRCKQSKSTPLFLELDGNDVKGLLGTDGE